MRPSLAGIPLRSWDDLARARGYANERHMLDWMYRVGGLTTREIGRQLNCSLYTVLYHLRKHHIVRRNRGGPNHVTKSYQEKAAS